MALYYKMRDVLQEIATAILLQHATKVYFKMCQVFHDKCDSFITICDSYYKMWRLLENIRTKSGHISIILKVSLNKLLKRKFESVAEN